MHRRYLSCSVSRCAQLPRSSIHSESKHPSSCQPTPTKTPIRKKKKPPQLAEPFKLKPISRHRFQDLLPPAPDRKPARKIKLPVDFFPTANATSYKLLRDSVSSDKIIEGAKDSRGGQDLKAMLERHEARAMMLNEQKTSDIADLGLSDEIYQGVSFAPGTFIEARRFVSTSMNFFLFSQYVSIHLEMK
jgi:hypothetical protein